MTEREKNQKQSAYKEKTFPVPFSLSEIKENISISTFTHSNLSRTQIIQKAFDLHSQGNILGATKYYQYYINQGYKDPKVFSNYGIILKNIGNLKEAELLTRKAIEINPDFADAYSNLGSILKDIGKLHEAEISVRKAIELNPFIADAHLNLGSILVDLGNLKDAELSTRKAIELKPDLALAHYNLGNILKNICRFEEAASATRKSIDLNPSYAQAHLNLGSILIDLGNLKEAELCTRKAIELKPNYAEAYSNLGYILLDLNILKEAELSVRKAIEINSNCVNAHINLGGILFNLGKKEEAIISEWKAIELDPSFSFLQSYRQNAKLINKTAFYIYSLTIFNHFRPVIEINPNFFEILVSEDLEIEKIVHIRSILKEDVKIRTISELIHNNLIYKKLVSNRGDHEYKFLDDKHNLQIEKTIPLIKLAGKKNIRFMYTAGKDKYTISSYWNKYYDGILCYGSYHEKKFKVRHAIPTSQMGYPRFDKYFKPGFERESLIRKFKCDPSKQTIVWLTTWSNLSSIEKYIKEISSLTNTYNIVARPHPQIKTNNPESYKKLFKVNFNYVDDSLDDNVQLFALADLMIFDYGGSMFGALYLNKNFAFLDMKIESKNSNRLGGLSSEDYLKSFFPERIATLENLKYICNYCLKNPPKNSVIKSLREEFFNTSYQGNSAERAYNLLNKNDWLKKNLKHM